VHPCQRHGNHSAKGWPAGYRCIDCARFQIILNFAFYNLHLTAGLPWYTPLKIRNPESGCIRLSLPCHRRVECTAVVRFSCLRVRYLSARQAATNPATMLTGKELINMHSSNLKAGPYGPQLPSPECVSSARPAVAATPTPKVPRVAKSQAKQTVKKRFI
jgi:hypothetical protein